MTVLVPSDEEPTALEVLRRRLPDATAAHAAVAFVTSSGVDLIGELCAGRHVQLVARAGGVTDPEALLRLGDEFEVDVLVVMGRPAPTFHPKLWLLWGPDRLTVFSGSGNLTGGGLVDNEEQFEVLDVPLGPESDQHRDRFDLLTRHAIPLEDARTSTLWAEWEQVYRRQRALRVQLANAERDLNQRDFIPGRDADKRLLIDDLYALYHGAVAADLRTSAGTKYVPTRFKQAIDRARDGADPVALVTRICRYQTGGFDIILDGDMPELTVERLVLDHTKPYHDLFQATTRQLATDRLRQFPSWRPSA